MKNWHEVHAAFDRLAADKAAYDAEEAYWIREGDRLDVWRKAGYATYAEYLEYMLGYGRKTARERIRTARALAALVETNEALSEGRIAWTAARELTRVATGETEAAWIEAVRGHSVRDVEEMVAGLHPGDLPGAVRDPDDVPRVLRFEVSGATYALVREALARMSTEAGHGLSDDEALELMAREVLGGPDDDGRASYQMALTRCSSCARTRAHGDGAEVDVDSATTEMVACDVQTVTTSHGGHEPRANQTVTPATRRKVLAEYHHRSAVPGCNHARYLDVHHIERQADGGTNDPDNLVPLCGSHHRAHHDGRLTITRPSGQVRCFHADGTPFGAPRRLDPAVAEVRADALSGLLNLGFRDREARRALAEVPRGSLEQVLRAALVELRPG